jgi:uncharacterized protein
LARIDKKRRFWLNINCYNWPESKLIYIFAAVKQHIMEIVGREEEISTFKNCMQLSESKMIAVYGRRRVGKTFLIRKVFAQKMVFEVSGLYKGKTPTQLKHFTQTIANYGYAPAAYSNPSDWLEAFGILKAFLDTLKGKEKKVIFIDELPWFDTPRSQFLTVFENFWNQYCTKRDDLLVVVCGSAASWMIKKILKNKGGLHNRVYEKIRLKPFNLYETEKFLKAKGIVWDNYTIAQLYFCTGGIPFYLDGIRKGESLVQFINRAFFQEDGFLRLEYGELFASLFDESTSHQSIIELLAKQKRGISREAIVAQTKLNSGGSLTKVLDELETSGFISKVPVDSKNKSKSQYKLEDFYSLFYQQYIGKRNTNLDNWDKIYASPSWAAWAGLAFERLCFYHISQIKKALNISAIESEVFAWEMADEYRGAQIDMVISRADRVANIVEMKFSKDEFLITKDEAKVLRNKLARYNEWAPKKILFLTMITSFGLVDNEYRKELVQNQIELKDLFAK